MLSLVLLLSAGVELGRLTWIEAKTALTPDTVVVIPLGAGAKEHGPHLKLDNDVVMANALAARVRAKCDAVFAPTLNYGFFPIFAEYAGSTGLSLPTSTAVIVDVVRSLAHHGPRRFYVLNTGVSTLASLEAAQKTLAEDGILLHYTNLLEVLGPVEKKLAQQKQGTHADEIETSIMLALAPQDVDVKKAVAAFIPRAKGVPYSPVPDQPGTVHNPSGVFGDPTLATREKGEQLVDALVAGMLADVQKTKTAALPQKQAPPSAPAAPR